MSLQYSVRHCSLRTLAGAHSAAEIFRRATKLGEPATSESIRKPESRLHIHPKERMNARK